MRSDFSIAQALDEKRRQRLQQFIREVSPDADPTGVMLFGQIMRANNLLIQAAERDLCDAKLTSAKVRLLASLHRSEHHGQAGGLQPSELSEMQGISRNTVSVLIAGLEKDGLVARELHGTDRRRFVIRLTPEGRQLLKANLGKHFKFISSRFDGLSRQERHNLSDLLNRLNEQLSKEKELNACEE